MKVHGAPPCQVGNAMTIVPGGAVHGTLGCAEFDMAAVEAAAEVAAADGPRPEPSPTTWGRSRSTSSRMVPARRVVVVSATDVARALRTILGTLGYRVDVVEPRRERIEPPRTAPTSPPSNACRGTSGPPWCSPITMPPG